MTDVALLRDRLRAFTADREWERFHTPRNLALALVGEVGELAELLQWVNDEDIQDWLMDAAHRESIEHELADIFAYLIQLADEVEVDLVGSLNSKIDLNAARYPISHARGTSVKHTEL